MGSRKCFYLFNCDNTYNLDVVKELLDAIKDKTTEIDVQSEKKYFRLHQMSELAKTIDNRTSDRPKMDYAIFVVNAHESRLSINEDNAGIGYAEIYRALLRATGERVIVIIGGDDNYRNASEEDGSVLSRWSRRKVSSQFKAEFLDGKKGFIFSWDKKHRAIHEEALLHFLDSTKKGEKFVYEKKRQAELWECETSGDQKQKSELHETKNQKEEGGVPKEHEAENCQGQKGISISDPQRTTMEKMAECNDLWTKAKEKMKTVQDQPTYAMETDVTPSESETKLVVHGRNQSDVTFIVNLFGDELSGKIFPSSGCPEGLKGFLENVQGVRSCFIVLNGKAVLEEFASRYKNLFLCARNKVEKKVVTVICVNNYRKMDEDAVTAKITETLGEKACVLWWRETFLSPEHFSRGAPWLAKSETVPDQPMDAIRTDMTLLKSKTNPSEKLEEVLESFPSHSISSYFIILDGQAILEEFASHYERLRILRYIRDNVGKGVVIICKYNCQMDEDTIKAKLTETLGEEIYTLWWRETFISSCTQEKHLDESRLVLKTRLRYGKISFKKEDVEKRSGKWTPTKEIENDLLKKWRSASNIELLVHEYAGVEGINHVVVVRDKSLTESIKKFFGSIAATGYGCLPSGREKGDSV